MSGQSPYRLVFRRGIVYEGDSYQLWAIYPAPLVAPASCSAIDGRNLVFREDVFDPLTRIRRGRFYRCIGGRGDRTIQADFVANGLYGRLVGIVMGQFDEDDSGEVVTQVADAKNALNQIVTLGVDPHSTAWRIIGIEQNIFGHAVFTLRAQSLFGVLPEIHGAVPDCEGLPLDRDKTTNVRDALDRLVDTYHRFQPVPTVDAARETTRVILAVWLGNKAAGKDLKDVIELVPKDRHVLNKAAFIVNRLHPRAKSAEKEAQASKGNDLREPTEDDAQTSVDLVGLILREIGWAAA